MASMSVSRGWQPAVGVHEDQTDLVHSEEPRSSLFRPYGSSLQEEQLRSIRKNRVVPGSGPMDLHFGMNDCDRPEQA